MMDQNTVNPEKITFKRYFNSLTTDQKTDLKTSLAPFISESHFYSCMRNNKWQPLMRKEIQIITNLEFEW